MAMTMMRSNSITPSVDPVLTPISERSHSGGSVSFNVDFKSPCTSTTRILDHVDQTDKWAVAENTGEGGKNGGDTKIVDAEIPTSGDTGALKVFTLAELEEFNGSDPHNKILIAVHGKVYDVTCEKHLYGAGKIWF
jgi:hypothetical protein